MIYGFNLPETHQPVRLNRLFPALVCLAGMLLTRGLLRAQTAAGSATIDTYDGKALLADESGKVSLFDISVPGRPAALSSIHLGLGLNSVALAGGRALAGGKSGIYILSLADPKAMTIENHLPIQGEVLRVLAAGNFGYAAFGSTITEFDIPSATVLAEKSYPDQAIQDLAIAGDYVYVLAAQDSRPGFTLDKIAIQDHLDLPVASAAIPAGRDQAASSRTSIYADGQYIYIASPSSDPLQAGGGFQLVKDEGSSLPLAAGAALPDAAMVQSIGDGLLVFSEPGREGRRAAGLGVIDLKEPADRAKAVRRLRTSAPPSAFSVYFGNSYIPNAALEPEVDALVAPNGSREAPAVELQTNLAGDAAAEQSLIRMTALATGADTIRGVDFYVNDTKVASDGSYPFEYRFAAPDFTSQSSLTLSACAVDLDGNRSCSAKKTVEVTPDRSELAVRSVSPPDRSHSPAPAVARIEARFSRAIALSSLHGSSVRVERINPRDHRVLGAVSLSQITFQPVSNRLLIEPQKALASGTYQVTLAADIRSPMGKGLPGDYVWAFTVGGDPAWINPASGNWGVAANWSTGSVPQPGDNVTIAIPGVTVTYNSGTLAINSLTVAPGSTLSLTAASLAVNGQGTIGGTLSLAGGTYLGSGITTVSGTMNWVGGDMGAVLNLAATATMQFTAGGCGCRLLSTGTINNQGTVNLKPPGPVYQFIVSGTVNNLSGGTWNILSDALVNGTGGKFVNTGKLVKSGGTGTTTWSAPLTGSGSISLTSGTWTLDGSISGSISGPINVGAGATLNYGQGGTLSGQVSGGGTFNLSASATLNGTVNFNGLVQITNGQITFNAKATIGNLNFSAGSLNGPGSIVVSGTLNWSGGKLTITGGLTANNLTLSASGTFSINLGSTVISVTQKLTLTGTLDLSFSGTYAPPVGSSIPIIKFSGGFTGSFSFIANLVLGNGDTLGVNLSSSGLSVTVQAP